MPDERLDFSKTVEAVEGFYRKNGGSNAVYIENRANGAAVINTLSPRIAGINGVTPTRSKQDRVWAAAAQLNAGDWFLPHPQNAPWVNDFLFEASAFPNSKFDDWVDSWSQVANELTSGPDYSMFNERVDVFAGLPPSYFRKPWEW